MHRYSVVYAALLFFFAVCLLSTNGVQAAHSFSGANSYFLWALSPQDRQEHLAALSAANVDVLRIFIVHIDDRAKDSSAQYTPDLEEWSVGDYQDGILDKIDVFMQQAYQHGIKLNLVFHDRYSLGVWQKDGYVAKYGSAENFYTDPNAQRDFDARIRHILQHKNPHFNNRPWSDLGEVVWAFAIQNEARGGMGGFNAPWTWHCARAKMVRALINQTIYITTGGGANWADSLHDANFNCPDIDIIGVHNYDQSQTEVHNQLSQGVKKALAAGKKLIYEEYGATGSQQANVIGNQADVANTLGVPFFPWQFLKCSGGDFEYYVGSDTWSTHKSKAATALNSNSPFDWRGGKKGNWEFCSASSECQCGCCSKQYSDDGRYKCTPGSTQCI